MPTRKQRRRRQKELRHEYEIVYVDEEGREVEVESEGAGHGGDRRNGKRETSPKAQKGRKGRPVKEVSPPSWTRVVKRALLFGPLIFVAFSVINSSQPLLGRLGVTAVYTAFFVPFMYLMDRAMYRAYLRRSGQQLPSRGAPKKR
jgi:Flp pilus assembly protein TadB